MNARWKTLKHETGQCKFVSPQVIREGKMQHTKHIAMANSLNRQYVCKINRIIEEMDSSPINPLVNYSKSIPDETTTFTFTRVNMSDLRKQISTMKGTGSMGFDDVSMRNIKDAQRQLEPIILRFPGLHQDSENRPNSEER